MSDAIRLASGQKAQLHDGRVEVVPESGRRYRLTVEHAGEGKGATLYAVARDYGVLLDFLQQTERLQYELRSLELEAPGQP